MTTQQLVHLPQSSMSTDLSAGKSIVPIEGGPAVLCREEPTVFGARKTPFSKHELNVTEHRVLGGPLKPQTREQTM